MRVLLTGGSGFVGSNVARRQDVGFGYFVSSLVEALDAGRRFTVWESPAINSVSLDRRLPSVDELLSGLRAERSLV